MNENEYLARLVDDFGNSQNYTNDEKKEFLEMLQLLIELNNNENNSEDIINLIINKNND